jgi:hypothetical protein
MTDVKDTNPPELHPADSPTTQTTGTKKPYVRPSFRYERVFVTTALSCGKVGVSCAPNTKSS